ncbi:hypothetical protein BW730_13210 [Tessaracoccus aquimaris]|uniref:HTH tetR-type domain-containing protein n=1 Tax=Tessaracoccus aquimaris TaxID=1332264 RepID=A0A1Q2CQB8_9ACTN|nr:hypothetical protein BW730_13210 [Tessaracoccus aquimaris]
MLEAALELFAEHGVAGTSLQMIAGRLGITKAAIYHHFPVKDQIVVEVLSEGLAQLDDAVAASSAAATPDERAWLIVMGLADIMVDHRQRYSIMMNDPTVGPILAADPHTAATFVQMESALLGPDPTAGRRLAVAYFLAACNAPAQPALREEASIGADVIHSSILSLGAHLLGIDPRIARQPGAE